MLDCFVREGPSYLVPHSGSIDEGFGCLMEWRARDAANHTAEYGAMPLGIVRHGNHHGQVIMYGRGAMHKSRAHRSRVPTLFPTVTGSD